MSTYTPGPWKIGHADAASTGPHTYIERTYNGDGVTEIAGTYTIAEVADQAFLPEGTQEANARLIAKAPALVELARRVAAHFADTDAPLGMAARALLAEIEP